MLVISRKAEQTVVLGERIVVRVLAICGGRVRLGIEAPEDVTILRGELAAVPEGAPRGDGVPAAAALGPRG